MLSLMSKRLGLVAFGAFLFALLPTQALSQIADPNFTNKDIVGRFAEAGHVGPYAYTKTVDQAHEACMAGVSTGDTENSKAVSSFGDYYKTCMADYVPFKKAGEGEVNACSVENVSWGECKGVAQASSDGSILSVKNTVSGVEGFANFQCSSGKLQYMTGSCAAVVEECVDGLTAEWPVTTPLWADASSSSLYVDKYGQTRHSPKPSCKARMGEAASGLLQFPKPTADLLTDPSTYDMSGSTSPQRCFNGQWLHDQSAGASNCGYIPKSCSSKSYEHNGCSFSLPSGAHDSVYVDSNPFPSMSVGSVEAYCWDGEWEIKAKSCQLSCDATIAQNTWRGTDAKSCSHTTKVQGTRIRPGLNVLIGNEEPGMTGNVTYACNNGNLTQTTSTCEPKSCDNIKAVSWGACRHDAVTGYNWKHGDQFRVSSVTDLFTAVGEASYVCKYGGLSSNQDGSMDPTGTNTCVESKEPLCTDSPTPPATCSGVVVNDVCCSVKADGSLDCNTIIPPIDTNALEFGPWSSYVNDGAAYNCGAWSPAANTVPEGQIYTGTRTCDQNQTRNRTIYKVWASGKKEVHNTETQSQTVKVNQNDHTLVGAAGGGANWTSNVTLKIGSYSSNCTAAGCQDIQAQVVVVYINGKPADGVSHNGVTWNSSACQGCYITLVDAQLFDINASDKSQYQLQNLRAESYDLVNGQYIPRYEEGLGIIIEPEYRGEKPSHDDRSIQASVRFTIRDEKGNTKEIVVEDLNSSYQMVCQFDNWSSC